MARRINRNELSEEAQETLTWMSASPAICVKKFCDPGSVIHTGYRIMLGNTEKGQPDWRDFPSLLCSVDCFEELCRAGFLICVQERFYTHGEDVYIIARDS